MPTYRVTDVFTSRATAPAVPGEADVTLRDGGTVHVRPVRASDEQALLSFYRGLSADSRSARFLGALSDARLVQLAKEHSRDDREDAFGVLALGERGAIVGHAMYVAVDGSRAEVAFTIADAHQGRGIGTILLGRLAETATAHGIEIFEASVRPENHAMISVFRNSGFAVRSQIGAGEIHLEFPTEITEDAIARFEQRDATAAINAVSRLLRPRSVAVIGASRRRGTIGGELMHNLVSHGFHGPVFPINPASPVVQSVLAYESVDDVPNDVDLAVIAVPAAEVLQVAEGCARKGVQGLVVISAGFAETGPEGREREQQLMQICRSAGMRVVGPNCMGVINTDPDIMLHASFAPITPSAGNLALMSQSGALGLSLIEQANVLGLGLSSFVSVGNKADLSGNDLIRYWEQDAATRVILLYLESFGNPRKFSRIAARVARSKPIIAVKSGRSVAGARATESHTGALVAASDVTVDALFRQTGVIRTNTLAEMFDVASLLACQPPPKGRRVAVLSNAGGPAILCADACEAAGLELPELTVETRAELAALLPPEASTANPVDMIASATVKQYEEAVRILGRDPNVDAIIVIFIPPLATRAGSVAHAVLEAARDIDRSKPVLTVFMQVESVHAELKAPDLQLPSYAFPENAAIALARAARYGEWLKRPVTPPAQFPDIRRDAAAAVVANALGRGDDWLSPEDVRALLDAYGIPLLQQAVVRTPAEAAAAARSFGSHRVALKAIAPGLIHKSEAGAVRLGLTPEEVEIAARQMEARIEQSGYTTTGFLLQPMAPRGVEMIVGAVQDERFGPVIACGAGGVVVELLRDVSVRLAPLSERDAHELVSELKTYPLLAGYRGSPPCDAPALEQIVLRLGALAEELPQVLEVDLNPVIVHEHGATVVDARVRLAARPLTVQAEKATG